MKGRRPRDHVHFPAVDFFCWKSQSHSAVRWLRVILSWTGFGGGIVSLKQIFINWLNLITFQCVVCVKSHPHQVIHETVAAQDIDNAEAVSDWILCWHRIRPPLPKKHEGRLSYSGTIGWSQGRPWPPVWALPAPSPPALCFSTVGRKGLHPSLYETPWLSFS